MWAGGFSLPEAVHTEAASIAVALGADGSIWELLKTELYAWQGPPTVRFPVSRRRVHHARRPRLDRHLRQRHQHLVRLSADTSIEAGTGTATCYRKAGTRL